MLLGKGRQPLRPWVLSVGVCPWVVHRTRPLFRLALIYSLIGTGISKIRGVDDELNTVASGGLSGLLYRSTSGLKGALRGSLYGLGISSLYVLVTSKERLRPYV
jgi:hypothetical protein